MQTELNIALAHHAAEGNEKGVQLCLWAGGDAHAPAPSLRFPEFADDDTDGDESGRFLGFSAIHEACQKGDARILERLGPDPSRDDFDELYSTAGSGAVIEVLAHLTLPRDVGAVIHRQVSWLTLSFGQPSSLDALQHLFQAGTRWETSSAEQIADVRRSLLRMPDHMFVDVLKLLATDSYCSPPLLQELGRTPTMRARMRKEFIPSTADKSRGFY